MNENHEGGAVTVTVLVERGMSRCLFGDWPRRALLKLAHPVCEGPSSFWIQEEDIAQKHTPFAS